FVVTGNGRFDANNSSSPNTDYGQSLLRLQINSSSAGFTVMDSFTPFDHLNLTASSIDLGSTGALLLPDAAGSTARPHLAIIGGQTRVLYVINRDTLGGFTSGGPDKAVQKVSLPEQLF